MGCKIGVRFLAGVGIFFVTASRPALGVHSASHTIVTRGKAPRA